MAGKTVSNIYEAAIADYLNPILWGCGSANLLLLHYLRNVEKKKILFAKIYKTKFFFFFPLKNARQ